MLAACFFCHLQDQQQAQGHQQLFIRALPEEYLSLIMVKKQ